ncbi:T9SS C-terminal target domain-containing protein [Maribellus luteus]|uniref:T9SS C-terminal target domain-containing protein n=1 Tax=Maribellus luteus TaxID=2305463 RepID=A0A399SXQ8_9BACT|nr:immunoglobulin domain-containing protein [Maribellus luteus]RIJ46633.1 T9SS C-terminal target domain-containing protein [Maribellus luteus]
MKTITYLGAVILLLIQLPISAHTATSQTTIAKEEYQSLVDLYNATVGSNWTNNTNWLDTINHSVADWFGITVENGHVVKIELPGNNLQEAIFESRVQLPMLQTLDLSNNSIDRANFNNIDSLLNLTMLKIENNKLLTRHISDIRDLLSYGNFSNNFTYAPQQSFGFSQEIVIKPGELLEIGVDPFYLSESDEFQWKKDGVTIPEVNNYFFDKQNATLQDAGIYTLYITSPNVPGLVLKSMDINVTVTDLVGGTPRKEYEALVDLYESTNGNNWTNNSNWLDTTVSFNEWHGITLDDEGHVKYILLLDNNLSGYIPKSIGSLKQLSAINISRNQIGKIAQNQDYTKTSIPEEIGSLSNLIQLTLDYNSLQFADLEPILSWPNFGNIRSFTCKHQSPKINSVMKEANPGETININLQNYLRAPSDQYQWVKGSEIIANANDSVFTISNITPSDEANYYCIITNSKFPDMEITNYGTTLKVKYIRGAGVPISEYKALEAFYNATNGDGWKSNTNWLDTINYTVADWVGIRVKNGHVYELNLDSNNVVGQIPARFYDLRYLESIGMVQNQLAGSVSDLLKYFKMLKTISLGYNKLEGTIPKEISELSQLWYMGLNNNKISGSIPMEISQCKALTIINLKQNNIGGEIPVEIGVLHKLRSLILSNNSITGVIPSSIGNLSELKVLDLSNNQLIGPIPAELGNLEKIYRLDISGNIFGQPSGTKSAHIKLAENNRQIPDALESILGLDTLHLQNNQLQFNDIEAILNWDNFSGINEFTYAPQNDIGELKTLSVKEGSSAKLFIDNYYPGPSDQYQWFKNGQMLPQATAPFLEIESVSYTDAGIYYCKVSNSKATDLVLSSKEITLTITAKEPTAVLAKEDLERLTEIFNTYNGEEWGNNWLDTVNFTINEWLGLQIENGHVSKIDLSNLNLEGEVLDVFLAFDSLKWLNLSNNNLYGPFPSFSGNNTSNTKSVEDNNHRLSFLNISNNRFLFSDLEPVASELMSIDTFIYSPQQIFGFPIDTTINTHDSISIHFEAYTTGENDVRHWYKSNTLVTDSGFEYRIDNASLSDSGTYQMQVTNNIFPDLRLESVLYSLSVSLAVGVDDIEMRDIKVYPNPASDKIFIETRGKTIDLSITNASGTKVFQKNTMQSDWINVDIYPKGLYLFRIKFKDQILYKKILLQ